MRRPRFTIASILVAVVFVAVAIASLRAASDAWESGVFGATIVGLLAAVLLAVHRTEGSRAYWMGFALFGGVYLGLSLMPTIEARLPTTKGLWYLDAKAGRSAIVFYDVTTLVGGPPTNATVRGLAFTNSGRARTGTVEGTVRLWDAVTGQILGVANGTTESFVRIGHSLSALLLGVFGGVFSRFFWGRERSRRGESADSRTTSPQPPVAETPT